MRSLNSRLSLVVVSGVFALGITGVSAAPQHDSGAGQHGQAAAAPAKPTTHETTPPSGEAKATERRPSATSANQAPPIPPAEPVHGTTKDIAKPTSAKAAPASTESTTETVTAETALEMLTKGNARWVADKCTNPHDEVSRRAMLAENGQHPTATILTCSDSRLPVERLFDCGVGDVFVIRVAGNIMATSEIGTIEYGVEHLHTPLLVVMGHSKCGAVNAAVTNAHVEGSIVALVDHIEPAVERARKLHPDLHDAEIMPEAIKENVWQSIFDLLKTSEIARTLVRKGEVKIIGAVCDISTGKVEFLGEHPWQAELITALSTPGSSERATQAAAAEGH